jgi:hypothetical protein
MLRLFTPPQSLVSALGVSSAELIITACELSSAVGAGVDATDAEADPPGLVASSAETSPLEAMIAAMTTARASNLAKESPEYR